MPTTSFASDIRPLFRDVDVEHMNDFGLDLSSHQEVRDSSAEILRRVQESGPSRMPPPPDPPWTAAQVALFKQWIDEGCPP